MGPVARTAWAVAVKDLTLEARGRQALVSTLFFATLVLMLFGFALGPDPSRMRAVAPGLLWLALTFAGLLAVARIHLLELDDGALEQLVLTPASRRAIYAGKALFGGIVMAVLAVVLVPLVALLYEVDVTTGLPPLALTTLLGIIGFAAVGTFYGALTVRLRAREVMLPLLMLPVVAPLLLAAVRATSAALDGDPLGQQWAWIQLLAGFDVVMLLVCGGTYGHLLDD
ncbi:MAG: heme exporter protein CcmB [Candidatus Limnocylindria bacterium]